MASKKTILVDTNVLLRLFLRDIEDQFDQSRKFFDQVEKGEVVAEISILVLNELIWIMETYYEKNRAEYLDPILNILSLKSVKILDADKKNTIKILKMMLIHRLDFTDLYLWIIGTKKGEKIISFDKKLNRLIDKA